MEIDFNKTECVAMEAFERGEPEEAKRLQRQFLDEVQQHMRAGMDHCPCQDESCELHGKCVLCVLVHRGHGAHLPVCMHELVNRRLEKLSALTEHTITDRVSKPPYLK